MGGALGDLLVSQWSRSGQEFCLSSKKYRRDTYVMIDKPSGKVAYAIMSFGGFLGMGNQYHPLPWSVLKYDTNLGGYVVNLDKRQLEGAQA